jgi:hypothetical protein
VIHDLDKLLARLMAMDQMDDRHFALFALGITGLSARKRRSECQDGERKPECAREKACIDQDEDENLFRPGSAVSMALESGNGNLIAEPVVMALIQDCWTAGSKLLQVQIHFINRVS